VELHYVGVAEGIARPGEYLAAFPNPSPGVMRLSWSPGPTPVVVYDVMGRVMENLPGEAGSANLSLPAGVYLVKRGDKTIRAVVRTD